jgi:hypothetical protein
MPGDTLPIRRAVEARLNGERRREAAWNDETRMTAEALRDVYEAWTTSSAVSPTSSECMAYYEDHRGEIDALVARQMVLASIT